MKNVLSIDVEDWYHGLETAPEDWHKYEDRIADATRRVLDILAMADTHATFFILGDVVEKHPDLVREIHDAGHEVGSHGPDHQFVYTLKPDQFEIDLQKCLKNLTDITGEPVVSYRAPYFSVTRDSLWALPLLNKLGIKYDSSIFPVENYRYGIPDAPRTPYRTDDGIIEVPISTYPVGNTNIPCGGGVYFRFYPYPLVKFLYSRLINRGEQLVFYLHPWEVDPGQPVMSPDKGQRGMMTRHYWALDKTAPKLTRLLRDFEFGPIREVINL